MVGRVVLSTTAEVEVGFSWVLGVSRRVRGGARGNIKVKRG